MDELCQDELFALQTSIDSPGTGGRPDLPLRIFHVQNLLKASRCQATTVSGLTMTSDNRHSFQTRDSQTQEPMGCVPNLMVVHGPLKNADLMPECCTIQLERSTGFEGR